MYATLQTLGGLFWTATYLLAIRQGHRDRTYGIPLVALWANISWEFVYTFVRPPAHDDPGLNKLNFASNLLWFTFDVVIVVQALTYGRREFPRLRASVFYGMFALGLATACATVMLVSDEFDDPFGARAAFGQNLLMSGAFLMMLHARGSLRGQSASIALCKMMGTGMASLAFALHPPKPSYEDSVLLPFLFVTILVYDVIYLIAVLRARRQATGKPGRDEETHERAA
ncbi:hypothetical protein GCM10012275_57150 [Longimycelium tulufanense]|uniref:Uncharacterized protein n=1 Tax=Longimycelium tulufanense TaxID=907463 RepID=A0A8J3CHQ9_9PSEU|nr:hypothetical protein [Longimycelium tulufanense]GGM79114.1 hypothetical protein GCM10012275_57150 [Longimycelium tulufanense]